jgi:hypothetical protein
MPESEATVDVKFRPREDTMVINNPSFDRYDTAILAETPRSDDDDNQSLEVIRLRYTKSGVPHTSFRILVCNGDGDMAFTNLLPSELKHIGEQLIKLSGV